MGIELGATYRDVVTGFRGVALAHCTYFIGPGNVQLVTKSIGGFKPPKSAWIEAERLELMPSAERWAFEELPAIDGQGD